MRPLISIITVTYNAAKTLQPTMQSISAQTFKDFEHIIIDGASTDDTVQLAKELATENTRIYSEPDDGLYYAMNHGMKISQGEYLMFLNAGDSLHRPDTLQLIADSINENHPAERPDIVYGQTCIVNGAERKFQGVRYLMAPKKLTVKTLSNGMMVCHQAMAVARHIAPEYDVQYRYSSDYDWVIRCVQKSKSNKYIDALLIDYLSEGLTTANHKASLKERYNIMCKYYGKTATKLRHMKFAFRYVWRILTTGTTA